MQALDLSRPALAPVAEAWDDGDLQRACENLLSYYAMVDRAPPVDPLGEPSPETTARASDALEGTFTFQGVHDIQPNKAGGGLDWTARGPRDDKEWAWFLNRLTFLRDMAEVARATGDTRYNDAISAHIVDWVRSNDYPARLTFSAQWRALEVARRILDSWTALFYGMRDKLSPEARLMLLCSLIDHADALRHHSSFWGGNHLLTEKTALALIAAAWPEFRAAPSWLSYALERSREEILLQTYPDGTFKELTNHYQRVVLVNLEQLLRVLRYAGRSELALERRAEAMWDCFAGVMRPTGTGPLNSAGDLEYNRQFVLDAWRAYRRPDWRYMATCGREGEPPADPPSRYYTDAGHAVMRDGWGQQAQWAFFDVGPHGSAHQHNDRLHLSLTLGQHDFLIDAGRYTYQPGKWLDYHEGAQGHNMLLLDGNGPVPPPLESVGHADAQALIAPDHDFFSATNRYAGDPEHGTGSAWHTRSVYYARGRYWLVVDDVRTFGRGSARLLWHFHPDIEVTPFGTGITANHASGKRLHILPTGQPVDWSFERGSEDPPMGWYSPDYNRRLPATTAIATLPARRPFTIVWLLWPGDSPAPAITTSSEDGTLRITVGDGPGAEVIRIDPQAGTLVDP